MIYINKEKPKSAKNRKKESTKPYGAIGRERRLVLFTSPFPHPAFLESVMATTMRIIRNIWIVPLKSICQIVHYLIVRRNIAEETN